MLDVNFVPINKDDQVALEGYFLTKTDAANLATNVEELNAHIEKLHKLIKAMNKYK
jgi:hypothetical protein